MSEMLNKQVLDSVGVIFLAEKNGARLNLPV